MAKCNQLTSVPFKRLKARVDSPWSVAPFVADRRSSYLLGSDLYNFSLSSYTFVSLQSCRRQCLRYFTAFIGRDAVQHWASSRRYSSLADRTFNSPANSTERGYTVHWPRSRQPQDYQPTPSAGLLIIMHPSVCEPITRLIVGRPFCS